MFSLKRFFELVKVGFIFFEQRQLTEMEQRDIAFEFRLPSSGISAIANALAFNIFFHGLNMWYNRDRRVSRSDIYLGEDLGRVVVLPLFGFAQSEKSGVLGEPALQ